MPKVLVYMERYRPFIMGGDVHQPAKCELQVTGPFYLAHGYYGYVAKSPAGYDYVVEQESGAIVGFSITEVRNDIETGDKELMVKQVAQGVKRREVAQRVSPQEFWALFKRERVAAQVNE